MSKTLVPNLYCSASQYRASSGGRERLGPRRHAEEREHLEIEAERSARDELREERSGHRLAYARLPVARRRRRRDSVVRIAVAPRVHELSVGHDRERPAGVPEREDAVHRVVEG